MTPFSGESTDSEADIADTEATNDSSQSHSRFKSYIDEADTMKSDHTYDLPYDSVIGKKTPEPKRKGTLFSNKTKTGTMSKGQKLLKTCAPYTAEHMRTVSVLPLLLRQSCKRFILFWENHECVNIFCSNLEHFAFRVEKLSGNACRLLI